MMRCVTTLALAGLLAACAPGWESGRWIMRPNAGGPITLYILAPETITAIARAGGITRASALTIKHADRCVVLMPPMNHPRECRLIRHEIRHCEEFAWHD